MRPRFARLVLVLVASLFLPGAGCNLFETRDPEAGGGGDNIWIPPTRPEIIVQNLISALEGGAFGDYQRAFAPDFSFVPDARDVTQMQIERPGEAVYANWNRDVETQAAEAIKGGTTSLDLRLAFEEEQLLEEGRLHKYTYTLTLQTPQGVVVLQGQAWFTIVQQLGGDWLIAKWEDVTTPLTVESWGLLKGRNRQI